VGANLFSLFTVSLIPFSTSYVAENNFASFPMALYAGILLLATFAYLLLQIAVAHRGIQARLGLAECGFKRAIGFPEARSWRRFLRRTSAPGSLLYCFWQESCYISCRML
jgi:hypothetical protein